MNAIDRKRGHEKGAGAIQARAAEWLSERRYAEDWTSENQADLDAWLAQDLAHEVAYWRLDAAWERTERLAALRRNMPDRTAPKDLRRSRHFLPRFATAVAVVGVVMSIPIAFRSAQPTVKSYSTAVGGQKTLILSDGSQITLNTDTAIRIQMQDGGRKVWLDHGEAYFEIQHDPAHPFTVVAAGHRITDLGTRFLVRDTAEGFGLKVALLEGRAELDSAQSQVVPHRTTLTPGDVAVADAGTLVVTHRAEADLAEDLSWSRGVLVFRHTALQDAVAEFNRYNTKKLAIADMEIAQMKIAGTFQARNPELFTEAVQELFKLHVSKSDSRIILSR